MIAQVSDQSPTIGKDNRQARLAQAFQREADIRCLLSVLGSTGLSPAYLEGLTGISRRRVGLLLSDASREGLCRKERSGHRYGGPFVYRVTA